MYDNLKAEMARRGITVRSLSKMIGVHENTLYRKVEGKTEFKLDDMMSIKTVMQTEEPLEYLFKKGE